MSPNTLSPDALTAPDTAAPGPATSTTAISDRLEVAGDETQSPWSTVLRRPDLLQLPVVDFVGGRPSQTSSSSQSPQRRESEAASEAQLEEAFQQGVEAGQRAAEAAADRVIDALNLAVERTETAASRQLQETNGLAVDIALELAALILRREVATASNPGRDAIERCLADTTTFGPVTIRLNPDDLARLGEPIDGGKVQQLDHQQADRFHLIADPDIASGDAVVDVNGGRLDGSITAALARVGEELRS